MSMASRRASDLVQLKRHFTLLHNEGMSTFELYVALNRAEATIKRHLYID